jgi:quinol monooxygenase YgiN
MLTIIAYLTAKDDQVSNLSEGLMSMVEPSRAEPGCINYDLHQFSDNPARFVIYENWVSSDSLDEHFKTPHFRALSSQLEALLAEPMVLHEAKMLSKSA